MASVAKLTAVSNPNVLVVPTMSLSMVLGTPTSGIPSFEKRCAIAERAVAADDHQGIEAHPMEHLDHPGRVVLLAVGGLDRVRERVAPIDGAENGPAAPENAGDVRGGQHTRTIGLDQPVEAVFEADHLNPVVDAGLHDGADDSIQSRGVAAARQNSDALQFWHAVKD